jgi:hypothetical protein
MCRHCWEEEGAPRIDTPAIRSARDLIQRVYDFNDVGGGLHVVVDDWNIEDDDLVKRYAAPDDRPEQVAPKRNVWPHFAPSRNPSVLVPSPFMMDSGRWTNRGGKSEREGLRSNRRRCDGGLVE